MHDITQLNLANVIHDIFVVFIVDETFILLTCAGSVDTFSRGHYRSVRGRHIVGRVRNLFTHQPHAVTALRGCIEVGVVNCVVNLPESDLKKNGMEWNEAIF